MEGVILEAKNLKKEFRMGKGISNLVIPGFDVEIQQGEFVVLMGNSGSGKSTLLYLMGGLDELSGGEIKVSGRLLPESEKENALFRRTNIGFVFQQNNLVPSLTLLENVLVSAYLVNKDKKKAKQRALELLKEMEIENLAGRYPSQVSGGEQQRCSIARALVNNPSILLADEPTGSLNSSSTEKVLQNFATLHTNGQTIVMVTHEVEAACYGQRVIYIRDGRMVDEFRPDESSSKGQKEKDLLEWLTQKGW